MDFHHPGLVGKIRTKRIHPGSSQFHRHTRATSIFSPNYSTVPRNSTTQFHILFRLLAHFQLIFTIQTVLQSRNPSASFDVHHAYVVPKANPLARSKNCEVINKKMGSLWAVVSVFILSLLGEYFSYREELYMPGKMRSRPLQRCIYCHCALMFDGVTIVQLSMHCDASREFFAS